MPINQEDLIDEEFMGFSLLRLNSFNSHNHPPLTTCNPLPTSSTFRCPNPTTTNSQIQCKKLFIETPQHQQTLSNSNLGGFSEITVPLTPAAPFLPIQTHSLSIPRRCISDPYTPPTDSMVYPPQSPPENAKLMKGGIVVTPSSSPASKVGSAALPPLPSTLHCIVSDPIKLASPSQPFSRSSCSNNMEESPSLESMKKLKECMREMGHWWDKASRDDEDDAVKTQDTNNEAKDDMVTEFEEAVEVERVGERMVLGIKCPCGKGHHIILSGSSCHYKLV
ncbi:hypothetical protein CFOL_v3_30857 [Cephalotus follicularis]|uniref:Uncharacterized protein n=1 Tax=Cephalotus follicularis TaxID=3775 RepID=A0A1Q3D4U6_CEPFO|nr:hypothetical protein CFOL_v3_30857 [Cephalotus follicularis]